MQDLKHDEKPLLSLFPILTKPSVLVPLVGGGLVVRGLLGTLALGEHSTHYIWILAMDLAILSTFWFLMLRPLRGISIEEAARAAGVVKGAPDGIMTISEHGLIESFNPPAERLFGYRAGEVLGRPVGILGIQMPGDRWSSQEMEMYGRRRDQSQVAIGLEVTEIAALRNRSFLCIVRDITQRKRAQEALARYQLLFENTGAIVLVAGPAGEVLEANRAALEAYGYDRATLLTLKLSDLQEKDQHRRSDGSTFPVAVSTSEVEMDGAAVRLHIVRDVTREQLVAATQALLRSVDQQILQQHPLDQVALDLCQRLADMFGYPLVWIGLKEQDGSVRIWSVSGSAAGVLDGARLSWMDGPGGHGPVGVAIRTGEQQLCDLSASPSDWSGGAIEQGVRFALALPLIAQTQTLGALCMCAPYSRALDPGTVGLLSGLADQVAISLLAARDQEQILLQTVALEAAANAVVITNQQGKILWVNPAWTTLTGYAGDETVGKTPGLLRSGHQSDFFYRRMWETILAGETWRGELQNRRKDGTVYIDDMTITPVRGQAGQITHFIAIKQDVTDRKRHDEQLRYLAGHDALTELPNRRTLKEHLERAVSRSRRGHHGALLMVDVDNFKVVNDTLGHAAGDRQLIVVANLLRRTLRPDDLLARVGGDEFAALLEEATLEEAREMAERLRAAISDQRFRMDGHSFDLGLSVGIAPIDGTQEPEGVMILADSALYNAKELGINKIVLHQTDEEKGIKWVEAGQWAGRIRDALADDLFVLYFQPIVRLECGSVDHFEALIRMRDGVDHVIAPGSFTGAAERYGLMPEIDRWVVTTVVKILRRHPTLKIFVNLSGQSLGDHTLLADIEQLIQESGIVPGQLAFEITETIAVRDLELTRQWMTRLKGLGCSFALDDFGIGFSSFAYLRVLPADYVKIDGSFIRDLDNDPTNRSLVQAIKTVAHTLGKQVIAEWVETEKIAKVLMELGVEHGQGFAWGQPDKDLPAPHSSSLTD